MVVLTAETCWALNEHWIYNKISGIKLVSLYSTRKIQIYDCDYVTQGWEQGRKIVNLLSSYAQPDNGSLKAEKCHVTRKYKLCLTDTTVDFTVYNKTGWNTLRFFGYTWLADLSVSPHVTTEARCCLLYNFLSMDTGIWFDGVPPNVRFTFW